MQKTIKGISLFSSCGIGEYYLSKNNIEIIAANELIPKRAALYKSIYKNDSMICGDITNPIVFDKILNKVKDVNIDFLIASPPCQGISIAGKNRTEDLMMSDSRNYLITYVIDIIKITKPNYILIENVPLLLKLQLLIDSNKINIIEYIKKQLDSYYEIEAMILDTSDYGVPQVRKRAIIKIVKKGHIWLWPAKSKFKKTVADAIGDLPSLESGEYSEYHWHFGRVHQENQIKWMKYTPTGKSAFENKVHFPKKSNGDKIKGYNSSYRRIKWDEPAPTITIRNDAISSQRNVHPGRLKEDGTYSDARVLSILELMRLTGLPDSWPIPRDTPEILIRQVLGECIPPLLIESLVKEIKDEN